LITGDTLAEIPNQLLGRLTQPAGIRTGIACRLPEFNKPALMAGTPDNVF
jgi:hypothetical protein